MHDAPQECPDAELLYKRAQQCKESSAAGSDGFAPKELKALPPEAWQYRRQVMQLMVTLKRYPKAYYTVYTPAIPKKGKGVQPLDHRLLAIFSGIYRIDAGAWFALLKQWFRKILHPKVVGAMEGMEALDVAWEAQRDLERAIQQGHAKCLASYDYEKYFDSFDHQLDQADAYSRWRAQSSR